MLDYAWLVPLLPALSFVGILLFGKRLPRKGDELGILAVGGSLVLTLVCAGQWITDKVSDRKIVDEHLSPVKPVAKHFFTWWQSGGHKFDFGMRVDGLTIVLFLVVTIVSFLAHVYSTAYMRGDRRYTFFYAALSLFTASILLLAMSDNMLGVLLGWEGTSVCSFMLIGHWWEEQPNSDAALKAFFTTRVGDIGLIIGIIMTYFIAGSFDINKINAAALSGHTSSTLVTVAAIALFCGVIGKSGQFPLHTWLPDAMAGPTPVSALIHAATMVVAGVFLVARLYGVFWQGFSIDGVGINGIALIGGITVLIGAALAFVQDDIKKVLAYSTISQLGYMIMALGVGAWVAAIFHLFTHAFFKANLFLGAGSVSHSGAHHSFDMKKDMGGLKQHMPVTYWTFLIGTLALAGVFPLAGFWSKDEILAVAHRQSYDFFLVVGLIGAVMTAAYMTRCVYLTFHGEYRGHGHPHESEKAITIPLVILATLSVVVGFLNAPLLHIEKFTEWFAPGRAAFFPDIKYPEATSTDLLLAVVSVSLALVGIATAWAYYSGRLKSLENLSRRNALAHAGKAFLVNKYYLDDLYEGVIIGSLKGPIAQAAYWTNQNVIDKIVNGVGVATRAVGRFSYDVIDQKVVDGAVNGLAVETGRAGGLLRLLQGGRVQRYALMLFAGVGLFGLALALSTVT